MASTIVGLQEAVALQADVVTQSRGGYDSTVPRCDGANDGWEVAVYNAHLAGVLTVNSAGNDDLSPPRPGTCQLTGLAEPPSTLVVGGLSNPTGTYSTAARTSTSSPGGVDVTIDGASYPEAFTQVGVLASDTWDAGADVGSSFVSVGGTSLSAPQVAGSALMFKDWMIAQGFSAQAALPGVIFTNMVAMTDREDGAGPVVKGFDKYWGGGRFQQRLYGVADHPSGFWRWEVGVFTVGQSQHVHFLVGGSGNEPSGIQIFKAYAIFFEQDGTDVADIDLTVYDKGCGAGSSTLNYDNSRDDKSMVELGSTAAGKDLCLDLYGYHLPPGETRQVVLLDYYTDQTSMR